MFTVGQVFAKTTRGAGTRAGLGQMGTTPCGLHS